MDKIITAQLDRVEAALTTLIDSITSYNPSVSAAQELLEADHSLSKGLEQLTRHQANHARLLALRQTAADLDQKVTADLTLLAETRKEVLALPATTFSPTSREVPYEELLNYARNIAKYTIPPSWRPKREKLAPKDAAGAPVPAAAAPPTPSPIEGFMRRESQQVNGTTSTPTLLSPIDATTTVPASQQTLTSSFPAPVPDVIAATPLTPTNVGLSNLNPEQQQWLEPLKNMPFTPWPTEEVMKMGALGRIQALMEQGVDPASLEGPDGVKQEVEGGDMEGVEVEERKEGERGVQMRGMGMGMGAVEIGGQHERKPSTFGGLDLYDPDEEP